MAHRIIPALFATVACVTLLAAPRADAADLDGFFDGGTPADIPEQKVTFGTGWYIRGDIGATRGLDVAASPEPYDYTPYLQHPAIAGTPGTATTITTPTGTTTTYSGGTPAYAPVYYPTGINNGPGLVAPGITSGKSSNILYDASLGAGYAFNRFFRTDVIADFHQPVASSVAGTGVPCKTGTYGVGPTPYAYEEYDATTCTPILKANLKSFDVLLNGYVDIGTWYSVTPYIGAGVGLSFGHAQASSQYIQGNGVPYNVNYTDVLSGATFNQYWDRSSSIQYYNLAFALMGGFAIDVYDHTKLDIGYRYLNLGSVLGTQLATQEVRAGLRYMIDN